MPTFGRPLQVGRYKVATADSCNHPTMTKPLSFVLAAIPALALSVAIPFVNRDEPRILGLPFLLAWIIGWVLIVPAFLWIVYRVVEGRR
jgi:hypothetical protein